jgi:hypothetical protein
MLESVSDFCFFLSGRWLIQMHHHLLTMSRWRRKTVPTTHNILRILLQVCGIDMLISILYTRTDFCICLVNVKCMDGIFLPMLIKCIMPIIAHVNFLQVPSRRPTLHLNNRPMPKLGLPPHKRAHTLLRATILVPLAHTLWVNKLPVSFLAFSLYQCFKCIIYMQAQKFLTCY